MSASNYKLRRSASFPLVKVRSTSGTNCSPRSRASSTKTDIRQHSTGRFYTLREINDQISVLRRENFNLKLDLFLLRERFAQKTVENEVKKFRLQLDVVRKELKEKTAVVKEAIEGMRLIEKVDDHIGYRYELKINLLQKKIESLENSILEKLGKIMTLR